MKDEYKTLKEPCLGEFRDRGSKFLAYGFPIRSEEEFQERLAEVKKEHVKARHHCYAWRLGLDGNAFRANDDGEPSGTAGRPILGQIDSFELTYVGIVVVRYFGGTLLGTSGLINAYRQSAADALSQAAVITRIVENTYRINFDYALMSRVMNGLSQLEINIVAQDFSESAGLEIAIRQTESEAKLRQLKAVVADVYLEEVDGLEAIPGFEILHIETR
ncbi:MAG: YigZ family protein [Lewinellaceae bacterium]|nr:YigZ family protein [Lewinella sp.]MCB9281102.1 YigZ family protein [Lewinellaceae bacterium]